MNIASDLDDNLIKWLFSCITENASVAMCCKKTETIEWKVEIKVEMKLKAGSLKK